MPSNVVLNNGTGGSTALTKQVTHDGDTTQCQGVHLLGISGTEDAYTAATINGDATNGLDVDVTRVVPGTAATNLGKAEDDAAASGDVGIAVLTVRQDSLLGSTSADGDYQPLKTDSAGRLYTTATIDAALPTGGNTIGNVGVNGGSVGLLAGAANIGNVGVTSIAAGDNNIGNVDVLTLPNVTLAAGTNTNEVVGDAAHDAPVAGNPLLIGAEARTTNPTAVANGDAVRVMADDRGSIVITNEAPRDLVSGNGNRVALTSTTETTLVAAVAAQFNDLSMLVMSNESATEVRVDIRDTTAGTVRYSVDLAADGGGAVLPFPVPHPQGAVNTNWTAQLSAAVSTVYISAVTVARN